jgi:hypothetical protein
VAATPTSEKMQGVFTDSMDELVSYRYMGCQAEMVDADHAVSHTALRAHLCTPGSVTGTALAISMMDAAGICVDRVYLLGLTEVDLQLYEPALDVARLRTVGHVVRWARTQVFTECRFEDADQPGRVLGAGAANWSVMFPTPEGFEYTDPGPGLPESPDTPPMPAAFELEPADRGAWVLPALSPRVGAEVLHHGPMLVATEQSALSVGAEAAGTDALALRSWSMRIVKAGRKAPFTATAEVLAVTDGTVGTRAELVDGAGDTIALSYLTHQVR